MRNRPDFAIPSWGVLVASNAVNKEMLEEMALTQSEMPQECAIKSAGYA